MMPPRIGLPRAAARPGQTQARDVKGWIRATLLLEDDCTVMVTELHCTEPDCPPYETVMAILRPQCEPVHKKLHRRLGELTRDEVVALWQADIDQHH